MKKYEYVILGEFRFRNKTYYSTITIRAFNLTDAIKEAKDKVIEDFGIDSVTLLDFKPDPLRSGVAI